MGWSLSLAMIAAVLASTGGFLKYVTDKGVAQLQLETPHQQLASLMPCGREPAGGPCYMAFSCRQLQQSYPVACAPTWCCESEKASPRQGRLKIASRKVVQTMPVFY